MRHRQCGPVMHVATEHMYSSLETEWEDVEVSMETSEHVDHVKGK
jgi:hypothetical protein